ncbi:MAG: response regulator [Candidatus Tantalella remota]|nr:response regulator [Candidatus Tantalella remota]
MAKAKILIVDDEVFMAALVSERLKDAGFDIHVASSGKAALEYAKTALPDLIVLDIMMPVMDGYEVARRLHKDPKTSLIPIIMLTAKSLTEDKVKALKMGIDDYIVKPYDPGEFIARIEAVLRRVKKAVPGPGQPKYEQRRVEFLKKMISEKVEELVPKYNMTSFSGYGYPYAAKFFETKDGSELNYISFIAEKGCLEKKFFDKVLLCPYCGHHDLNIRETCPSDHSPNISVVEMIHHFRCGYVGTEEEFSEGIRYVCPKCKVDLRQIGIDYDKPGQSYVSNETGEKFTEPSVYCQCRNCLKMFAVDDAGRKDIFSYTLTVRAGETVEAGHFTELNLEQALIDEEVDLYNLRYFRKQFAEEMQRSEKFKRAFSLILVNMPNFNKLTKDLGMTEARSILKEIASILKENLWEVDTPARYDKNSFITLLPEADRKKAASLARMLKKKLDVLKAKGPDVRIAVASYPDDATTENGLIEHLLKSEKK